jgi:hypothetical protein
MRVRTSWSYDGKGFDLRELLLNRKLHGKWEDPDGSHDQLYFRQAGTPQRDPRGPTYNKEDIWGGRFSFGPDLTDTTGRIESIGRFGDGKHHGIAGLQLPYEQVAAAMKTKTKTDDMRIFEKALSGHDSIDTTFNRDRGMNDRLEGFAGNDKLTAGSGADRLYGGRGADTFIYKSIGDSTPHYEGRDTIFDFSSRQRDKIDIRKVDASDVSPENQAFSYIGEHAFSNRAGELRWEKVSGGTFVCGDVNGDGSADFSIYLKGISKLSNADFYL